MKRIISLLLSLLLILFLPACAAPENEPEAAQTSSETSSAPQHPYEKPSVAEGETLLWYGDGQHYRSWPPQYTVVGFPDEYLTHRDKTFKFDDGPEDKRNSAYFSSVLTGKAPVSSAQIVILSSDHHLPWEAEKLSAVIYEVSVDDLLDVTLGEPRLCAEAAVSFEWTAEGEKLPMNAQSSYASEGGGFHLSDSITDGTPYSQMGIIYDRSMLAMEKGGEYDPGEDSRAAGGGAAYYRWEFSPLTPGESDILILTGSYTDGPTGVMVHVSVDEGLDWSLDWYAEGAVGRDFQVYAVVEGVPYPLDGLF